MRIEPTGKTGPLSESRSAQPDTAPAAPSFSPGDQVQLSTLSQAVAYLPPERLQQIQNSYDSGNYQPNSAQVSRSMVDFYLIPLK